MSDGDTFFDSILALIQDDECYRGRWICDESLVRILHRHYSKTKEEDGIRSKLVRRLNKAAGAFDDSNANKIYKSQFRTGCPLMPSKRRVVNYYYFGNGKTIPKEPKAPVSCSEAPILLSYSATNERQRSCNMPKQKSLPGEVSAGKKKERNDNDKPTDATPRQSQRGKFTVPCITVTLTQADSDEEDEDNEEEEEGANVATQPIYWSSPEAAKLFGCNYNAGDDPYELLEERIELLENAFDHYNGYREVVTGEGEGLSDFQVHRFRQKGFYLRNAYAIALEKLGVVKPDGTKTKWIDCCKLAVERAKMMGYKGVAADTIMEWNRHFRRDGKFPHPDPYFANGIRPKPKPALFEFFPQAALDITDFIIKHQDHFTVDMVVEHFNKNMLPALHEEAKELGDESEEKALIDKLMENNPKFTTVYRWVKYIGFTVQTTKKSYYVDGHEYPEQKTDRIKLAKTYLVELEPRCSRWIQMTLDEFNDLQASLPDNDKIIHNGYDYESDDGTKMKEFHVDNHMRLMEMANEKYTLGGTMSVRAPTNSKLVVIFGQDEAIFSENCSLPYQWVDPNGKRVMLPKSNGASTMISAFQSREYGFGMEITEDQMKEINAQRKDKHYTAEDGADEAALKVNGTTAKPQLTSSPFVQQLAFGGSVYWNSDHMILQVCDIMDCLKVIEPEHEYVFLFDHSSGHAKKRANRLDVKNMNVDWGGSAGMDMRTTNIEARDGYIGPYHDEDNPWMVKVGQTLGHVYPKAAGEEDSNVFVPPSPFNLTATAREEKESDVEVDIPIEKRKERSKHKKELIAELMETETGRKVGITNLWKLKLPALQEKARGVGIDIKITPTTKTKPGWRGRGIGLLAAAYARGWVDIENLKQYQSMKYDDDGNLVKKYSLQYLLGQCKDFQEEVTQLEFVCKMQGARAIITPKYHAELAGEGIEYTWGFLKSIYRRFPLAKKKGKANFEALLAKILSRDNITTNVVRKFSRRARAYMETYVALDMNEEKEMKDAPIPHRKIEQLKKVMKSHRAAIDFDKSFVLSFVAKDGFDIKNDLDKKPAAMKAGKKRKTL